MISISLPDIKITPMNRSQLIQLINKVKPVRTLLVHGDLEQAQALSEKIQEMTDVCIPERNEVIDA